MASRAILAVAPEQRRLLIYCTGKFLTAPASPSNKLLSERGKKIPIRITIIIEIIDDMVCKGDIYRLIWGHRHCLFTTDGNPGRGPELWWLQVAALRDDPLKLLYHAIQGSDLTLAQLCGEMQHQHNWNPSTTKARTRKLREVGLVDSLRLGKRYATLQIRPLHPNSIEALHKPPTHRV